ncbi:MAG: DNA mismatch repair endonuclease MutL [Dehalococcoidia bacterium]|nr:DNA mismatch repair endonuclease MutL [Dehalococcoidia bacterium]
MIKNTIARIEILPEDIAARIAAGEVIERPASVVKELVENSIDAGATRVDISIDEGGISSIRVRDNGHGIPSDQINNAFIRHATSKLKTIDDLYSVRTLGFRGEALASIVAAGNVDLITRTASDLNASFMQFNSGTHGEILPYAAAKGTSVEVNDLFAMLPARRKFIGKPLSEKRAVVRLVEEYIIGYPSIRFVLMDGNKILLKSSGNGVLQEAIATVHGNEVAETLIPFKYDEDLGSEMTIRGFIGPPSLHRSNRNFMHLFVQNRAIKSRSLNVAIEQSYSGLIPRNRHPVSVLLLQLPDEHVDVNAHPRKESVRFLDDRSVFKAVRIAVSKGLMDKRSLENRQEGFSREFDITKTARQKILLSAKSSLIRSGITDEVKHYFDVNNNVSDTPHDFNTNFTFEFSDLVPILKPIGQFALTYIIAEGPEGLYLIDQHAAHERVQYEKILRNRNQINGDVTQPLLQTIVLEMSASELAFVEQIFDELHQVGWILGKTDGNAILLRGIPAILSTDALRKKQPLDADLLFREYIASMESEEGQSYPDRVAASLACRSAVMAGDILTEKQQRVVIEALEKTNNPQTCPHGRPTMLYCQQFDIERAFLRR